MRTESSAAAAQARSSLRLRTLAAAGAVLLVAFLGAAGIKSHQDLASARAREAQLQLSIAATDASVRDLRRRIERLREDPVLLERLARQDLGWIKPGDVVVVFPETAR